MSTPAARRLAAAKTPLASRMSTREKRETKAVEAFVPTEVKEKAEFVIGAGAGEKLGDIENVKVKMDKLPDFAEQAKANADNAKDAGWNPPTGIPGFPLGVHGIEACGCGFLYQCNGGRQGEIWAVDETVSVCHACTP